MKQKSTKLLRALALIMLLGLFASFAACSGDTNDMKDGYYTAQIAEFDEHGWKEFVTIYVSGNKIVMIEYNARNESGFVKSWDLDYMRVMQETDGTYPNEYVRLYAQSLMETQNPDEVDAISGATHSHVTFQLLARAAIEKARAGDISVAFVER